MSDTPSKFSPAQARELLWRQGNIIEFLLDKNQKEVYKQYKENNIKTQVVVLSRQSGKTYALSTIAVQECLQRPGIIVTFCAPRLNQAKKIAKTTLREVLKTCPKDIAPEYKSQENLFRFPNGSILELGALNQDRADDLRGSKSHLIIVDEAGFVDDLKYTLRSVLYPKLNTTKGNILICSTPPRSAAHEFYDIIKQAEFDGTLVKKTIHDCPRYTKEDIEGFAKEVGGADSTDFKREYLCQMITDEESAIIPEATDENMDEIVYEHKRPPFFDAYVSMDIGFKDLTVVLFGYYDFRLGVMVIEDEIVIKGRELTTSRLATLIAEKEEALWGFKPPYMRVADNNNLILLNELTVDYGLTMRPSAKDNKEAALNNVRLHISDEMLSISPKCKTLIFHLKSGTWNKQRTSYDKTPDGGHADAIDALSYMLRNIQKMKNPYPYGFDNSAGDIYDPNSDRTMSFEQGMRGVFSNPFKHKRDK
ncbi:MAG: terminase large subunit domain-containing protein [Bacteroidales bacterium]